MARSEIRTVAIYEDEAQGCFVRHLIKRLGLRPDRLTKCENNVGVLERLCAEVNDLRSRNYQKNVALLVVIDADDKGVRGRVDQLLGIIKEGSPAGARRDGERIAFVIPAWEIENWYVHLCLPAARPIDESKDYKPTPEWRELAKDIGASAKRAVDAWGPEPGRTDPPSLVAARAELARVG